MLNEILGNLLAGLGLFFIGIRFIGEQMNQMAGRGFRLLVARLTRNSAVRVVCGVVAGALVPSTTAVTFIMTSLVSSRFLTVRKAMPIVAWSNVGNSALIFVAMLDFRLFALYLVGIMGIGFFFELDKSKRFRDLMGGGLGLGLLFLGLGLMQTGAEPLAEVESFKSFLAYTQRSYLLGFFIGGFITLLVQSSITFSLIAITLAKVGLLGLDQTIMLIYGSSLGSGLSTGLIALNLKGTARQLALFQAIFRATAVAILVPFFYAEMYLNIDGVRYLVTWLSQDTGRRLAFVFLTCQLTSVAVMSVVMNPVERLLQRLCPATEEEGLSRTQFIYEQALDEPETALDLVEKEHLRLMHHLPEFLDAVRAETASLTTIGAPAMRKAVNDLGNQVTSFITDLMDQHHQSRGSLERALNLQNRTEIIVSVADTLDDLVAAASQSGSERLTTFTQHLAEALHLILTIAHNTAETPDEVNRDILFRLTADRGEMMEEVRRSFMADEALLNAADHQILLTTTTLFERTVWLLRRLGALLTPTK